MRKNACPWDWKPKNPVLRENRTLWRELGTPFAVSFYRVIAMEMKQSPLADCKNAVGFSVKKLVALTAVEVAEKKEKTGILNYWLFPS